jgi:hypothetical protein
MQESGFLRENEGNPKDNNPGNSPVKGKDRNARRRLEMMDKKVRRYCEHMKRSEVPNKHIQLILNDIHMLTELLLLFSCYNGH